MGLQELPSQHQILTTSICEPFYNTAPAAESITDPLPSEINHRPLTNAFLLQNGFNLYSVTDVTGVSDASDSIHLHQAVRGTHDTELSQEEGDQSLVTGQPSDIRPLSSSDTSTQSHPGTLRSMSQYSESGDSALDASDTESSSDSSSQPESEPELSLNYSDIPSDISEETNQLDSIEVVSMNTGRIPVRYTLRKSDIMRPLAERRSMVHIATSVNSVRKKGIPKLAVSNARSLQEKLNS